MPYLRERTFYGRLSQIQPKAPVQLTQARCSITAFKLACLSDEGESERLETSTLTATTTAPLDCVAITGIVSASTEASTDYQHQPELDVEQRSKVGASEEVSSLPHLDGSSVSSVEPPIASDSETDSHGLSTTLPTVLDNYPIILKKIFNLSSPGVELLKVNISIGGGTVVAIIDSGAEHSLVSSAVVDILKLPIVAHEKSYNVIGQNSFATLGTVSVRPSIHGVMMDPIDLVVFPGEANPNVPLLLGIDFLSSNKFELCFKKRIMIKHSSNGGRIEFYLSQAGETRQVLMCDMPCFSASDVKLEQGKVGSVPIQCNLPISDPDHITLYTDSGKDSRLSDRVTGLTGISSVNSKSILMMSSSNTIIKKGQPLGSFNSVLQLEANEDDSLGRADGGDHDFNLSLSELTLSQQALVVSSLDKFKAVFSSGDSDIGLAGVTEHNIKLTDNTPIFQRPRRFPQPISDEIERQCSELNSLDIIEPSSSPWSSPVVPVRKKDGSIRMCIDYRKVNRVTVPDKFPVPNLVDSIFGLKGTNYFTRLDLVRGYYQLPIDEESRPVTAFSTQRNHWQFKRLSFGLRNAPAAFQREIQAVLSSFPSNKVIAYIDDILIMSHTFDEHLQLVVKVLQTLLDYNIKIKPVKCEWFKSQVEYLGHIVSPSGIRKTDAYVKKIAEYPKPKTVGELREFLGFINFQRKFLPNCSEVQKPLSCLTGGRKSKLLVWTIEMDEAFLRLKEDMQHDLELAYPDYSQDASELELWVDASGRGAGAYLAQRQGESHRVIGFASMTFTPPQLNYSTLERELTALRWGVKTFKPFLYGVSFILYTDHQPLVHLHNMKLVCSRLARTVEELSDYIFEIRYLPGHLNTAADALSRLNCNVPVPDSEVVLPTLPSGLIIDGQPAPGGGDSLFISLLRCLQSVQVTRSVPCDEQVLREMLVDDLLNHSSKYNLQLDREARRILRLMRTVGQLPALDVLLSASRLFGIRIFVYFWTTDPVIYQYGNFETIIHLQCLSGIHFNPLIAVTNYSLPDLRDCSVYGVQLSRPHVLQPQSSLLVSDIESEINNGPGPVIFHENISTCLHSFSKLPTIGVLIGEHSFCAVLDSGAEISLISAGVLGKLEKSIFLNVVEEHPCDIVGLSGARCVISQTVTLALTVGTLALLPSKFAVVADTIFPYCFLLGLDFLSSNNIGINLSLGSCMKGGIHCAQLITGLSNYVDSPNLFMVQVGNPNVSHVVRPSCEGGDLRFEISGPSQTVNGLSLLMDNDIAKSIQSRSSELRALRRVLSQGLPPKQWPHNLKPFRYHANKLSLINNIIVYSQPKPVIVVSFTIALEIALVVHFDFAHIGRDKLLDLLHSLIWHPSRYKIVNDLCTSCHHCQLMKEYSTSHIPPTLKIHSSYPFELLAADLISLPRTSSGFIGCLVLVDHFSKWVSAVPIRNKKSSTIVHALANQVLPFLPSIPTNLLTDNGPEFTSSEFNEFLEQSDINHKLTTPYCPSSNGAVERVNRTIQNFCAALHPKNIIGTFTCQKL